MSLWFVTPAHERFEITQQTLAQRAKLIRRIGARCVVIAEDANLDIARGYGLDTVEVSNHFLGRRFNKGVEYAIDNGATHITLFDSDSISLDCTYEQLPEQPEFRPYYSFVVPEGDRRGEIHHQRWVQTIWPVEYMKAVDGAPCDTFINKHVSSSALRNITRAWIAYHGKDIEPIYAKTHKLEHVGFQSEDNISQVYPIMWSSAVANWRTDVWNPLLETYTEDQEQILALKSYYERKNLVRPGS